MENGKTFVINAENNSKKNLYVNDITLNGKEWNKNYVSYEAIENGGELDFTMASSPNKKRGTTKESYPYSMTNEEE